MRLLLSTPEWLSVSTLCTIVIGIVGFITALIKLKAATKKGASAEGQQSIIDKLTDQKSNFEVVVDTITTLMELMNGAVTDIRNGVVSQEKSNSDVVKFVQACFDMSNLSDEAKAKLALMCDEIVYKNDTVITKLATANHELEKVLAEKTEQIAQLVEKIEALTSQVSTSTSVTKSRRTNR